MRKHHLVAGLLLLCGPAAAAPGVTTIANPGGGTIAYAQLPQQHTAQGAMGKVLQYVESNFGARPDIDKVLKSPDGNSLAVTFTVSPKSKPQMAGLALVAVSASGPGAGAVLSDTPDHLRTSLKPMLATLQDVAVKAGSAGAQAAIANASGSEPSPASSTSAAKTSAKSDATPTASTSTTANPVKATAPAQKLTQTPFPDGAGSVGLPAGWKITGTHQGDVSAQGPNGEKMRFGVAQQVIDFSNPQSRALGRGPGGTAPLNFVAIPFGTPGDVAYKQTVAQLAQKQRRPAPSLDYSSVTPLKSQDSSKKYFLQGNVVDADGPGVTWVEVIEGPMGPMGIWTLNIYAVTVPQALANQEMATVLSMFPTYKTNNGVILAQIGADERQTQQITNTTLRNMHQMMDASDRSTQATSDYLRGQTVISDSALNAHGRVDDDVANALIAANPNRFQAVSSSGYIRGIDY